MPEDADRLSDSRFKRRSSCFLSATLSSQIAICILRTPSCVYMVRNWTGALQSRIISITCRIRMAGMP